MTGSAPNERDVYDLPDPNAILRVESVDPAVARRQVQRWSEIDPVYGAIAAGVRKILRQRSGFRPEREQQRA